MARVRPSVPRRGRRVGLTGPVTRTRRWRTPTSTGVDRPPDLGERTALPIGDQLASHTASNRGRKRTVPGSASGALREVRPLRGRCIMTALECAGSRDRYVHRSVLGLEALDIAITDGDRRRTAPPAGSGAHQRVIGRRHYGRDSALGGHAARVVGCRYRGRDVGRSRGRC